MIDAFKRAGWKYCPKCGVTYHQRYKCLCKEEEV